MEKRFLGWPLCLLCYAAAQKITHCSPLTVPVRWVACKGGLCFNPSSRVARLAGAPSLPVNRPLACEQALCLDLTRDLFWARAARGLERGELGGAAPILWWLAPKINLVWDSNRELARRLRGTECDSSVCALRTLWQTGFLLFKELYNIAEYLYCYLDSIRCS